MTQITTWITSKLEYIFGTICGVSTIALDIPHFLVKFLTAVALGGAGYLGTYLMKELINKICKIQWKKLISFSNLFARIKSLMKRQRS